MPPTPFEATDYPHRPGDRRYEKIIRFSTVALVKAGWLVKTKGTWRATDEGLDAFGKAGANVEQWYRDAEVKYRQWKKDQPESGAVADVGEAELEKADVTTTFEEASEAAFADIRAHVAAMSPYDFQDVVAALLEAMGYHALWIAPPGPDHGVDILAGQDPLGVQDPYQSPGQAPLFQRCGRIRPARFHGRAWFSRCRNLRISGRLHEGRPGRSTQP